MSSNPVSAPGRESGEKNPHAQHYEGRDPKDVHDGPDVAKVVHTDGTIDYIDAKAIGGDVEEMPRGYFWSPQFIGTVTVGKGPHLRATATNMRSRHNVWEVSVPILAGSCPPILCMYPLG